MLKSFRKPVALVFVALAIGVTSFVATGSPTASAASGCGAQVSHKTNQGVMKVQYCPIWTKARVTNGAPVVGYLNTPGGGNWFKCSTHEVDQYGRTVYFGYTEADNGKWGFVEGYYYAGSQAYFPGLKAC